MANAVRRAFLSAIGVAAGCLHALPLPPFSLDPGKYFKIYLVLHRLPMNILQPCKVILVALVAALFCSGCHSPKAYTISIVPHTTASVEVDLVGVAPAELEDWQSYKVTDYFQSDNPMRRQAVRVPVLVAGGKANPPEFSRTNAQWTAWLNSGVTHLVILANLPGNFSGSTDSSARRKVIDLSKKFVFKNKKKTIEIEIQDARIKILTPQKN